MKKNRRWYCAGLVLLAAGFAFLVTAGLAYYFYIGPRVRDQKRASATPPSIIVHSPSAGETSPAGVPLPASATATSRHPIARVELWLDGNLYQQQTPSPDGGQGPSTFYASFEVDLTEGLHTLVFRALDSAGLVGQSLSIPVTGTGNPVAERSKIVSADAGQTLEDIAKAAGADPADVRNMNPGLGDGGLPGGTPVTVPKPPADDAGTPNQPQEGGQIIVDEPGPLSDTPGVKTLQAIKLLAVPGDLVSIFLANQPKAPSSLQVGFEDCAVQMQWFDNANNEANFTIWMQRVYGPPQLIATLPNNPQNGPTRFDFAAPAYGIYSFWVEATNGLGGQSSEVREILVANQTCGAGVATQLEIEALDMYVIGPYENVHCYLSLDGTPAKRIPGDGEIQVENSWGDIAKYWGGEKKILFPMPEDEELSLEGECVSPSGNMLASLGSFGVSVPRALWNGSRLELKTDSFLVGYRVQPFGPEQAKGMFQYADYGLGVPEIWSVEAQGEFQIPEKDFKARTVTLSWHWAGKPEEINSFLIMIDGKDFRYVSPLQTQESILMGSACGQKYSFQVVAVGPRGARSVPSTAFPYQQTPCPVMAEVKFLSVQSNVTDDSTCYFPIISTCYSYNANSCYQLSIWYDIGINSAGKTVWIEGGTDQLHMPYKCKIEYQLTSQLRADTDTVVVPIDPADPSVRLSTLFHEYDSGGPNDTFGRTGTDIVHSYQEWPSADEDFTLTAPFQGDTADLTVKGHIRGFYYPGP
jgi:hypothetical protein